MSTTYKKYRTANNEPMLVDASVLAQKAIADKVGDDLMKTYIKTVKITDSSTTLGDVSTLLNTINNPSDTTQAKHVLFDVSALGANMYLCTIFIDTTNAIYRIFDMVTNRISEGTYDAAKLLTMAIANADMIATQSQIDNLQEQVNELGGKSIIEDWDALGDLIESGESTNYIKDGDTIDVNWIKTVLGTITGGATVTCNDVNAFITQLGKAEDGQYLFVYNGTKWTLNEEVIDDITLWGLSISGTVSLGAVMTIVTTVDKVSYTFVGYDDFDVEGNSTHHWGLEQTYAPSTKAYDSLEALFCLAPGNTIPAKAYKLTANYQNGGTPYTLYFTVAEAIEATNETGKIQFAATGTNWTSPYYPTTTRGYKYGTNTTLTPTISLSTTAIEGATDISTLSGVTIHDSLIQCDLGNNNYARSNIRAWLNDNSKSGNYTPSYEFDRPSGYNLGQGFLYGIDPRVLNLMLTANVKFTAGYDNVGYTQGQTYTVQDKVFLLSMKEMGFNINTNEGNMTDYYGDLIEEVKGNRNLTNDAIATRAKYNKAGGTKNNYRWSRSAYTGFADSSWNVLSTGGIDRHGAFYGRYFAPAFIIGKNI